MIPIHLARGDALVIVDVQNDFLPGGKLAVRAGDEVIAPLNSAIDIFVQHALPILATRDWHPENHCSFKAQGGTWPPHCIAGSEGAAFAPNLNLPQSAIIISKATDAAADAYSGFEGTSMATQLREAGVKRIFVGGLATDYCVLNTVQDGLALGFRVVLLVEAIRAVDLHPRDGRAAIDEMIKRGAEPLSTAQLQQAAALHW